MRSIALIGGILAMCTMALSQTTTTKYPKSSDVVDASGNFIDVQTGATVTTASGTSSSSTTRVRDTRITVVSAGATSAGTPVTYAGVVFNRLGVGKDAVYFEVTTPAQAGTPASRAVIALNANLPLPGSVSGFPALPLTERDHVRLARPVGASDYISIVTPGTPATSTASATPATESVYSFNNGAFHQVSKAPLP
jgi:hypothetical protein